MIIKTKRFILRHIRLSDLNGYYETYQGKNMKQKMLRVPKNLNEAKKELKIRIKDHTEKKPFGESFAIEINGEFAGYVDIHHLNLENQEHKCEIGYALRPKYRGKGITNEAVKLITDYAFKKYKLKRISAMGRLKNTASMRVLEKAGYKLEGVLRKNKCVDGIYFDDFLYAKVK